MTNLKTTRRQFLATTGALTAAGMASGMPTILWAADGKALRLRLDNDIKILDPGYMVGGPSVEAQKQCLPFLAEYVRDGDAVTWQPTAYVKKLEQRDPTQIDFELVDGLMWSDGYGKVKASDVAYSYERMKGSDWGGYFDALDTVEVTGELTGTLVLKQPFAPFFMVTLCHGPGAIVCEKAVEDAGGRFTDTFPATCGPYTLSTDGGQRVVFELDPAWTGPIPDFNRVECNIIPEIKASELAFEAGELDCTVLGSDTLARYQKQLPPNTNLVTVGELQYMWLGMNTQHEKLKDIKVRKAIQYAVDVDSILAGAYSNTSAKSNGIICPGLVGHREQSSYSYDPAKARELLAEASVSGLSLTLRTLNTQERMLTAQIIQANLAAIGITVTVLPVDNGPFWEMGAESAGDQWQDLEIWLMRFGTVPDPYEATQWFVSSQVGIWNWERWTDPEFDRLYEEGVAETDTAKRAEIYLQMQQIMEDTGAYVWINHEPQVFAYRDGIEINAAPSGEKNYHRFKSV
ncbi:MAG: ABC transporter substrate-binding protein [Maritimibacter sp.]